MCRGLYITAVAIGDCAMRRCSRCWCKQSRLMIPGDSSHELWCRWPTFINQRRVGGGERREAEQGSNWCSQHSCRHQLTSLAWKRFARLPPPAFICLNCDLSVPVSAAHSGLALTRPLLLHHAIQIHLMPTRARVLLIQWPLFTFTSCFLFIAVQPSSLFCYSAQKENTEFVNPFDTIDILILQQLMVIFK